MPDTFDQLLSFGATPDWISPLSAIISDLTNGPHQRFFINRNTGWSVNQIKRFLKQYGVHVWGDMIIDDLVVFTVRKNQAKLAQYVLQQTGLLG
jgi:hypothetical protein